MSHLAPSSRPISTTPSPRHSITLQSPSPSPSPLSILPTLHSSPSSVSGSPASSHARQDSVSIQIPNGRRDNGLLRDPSFSSLGQRSQSHLLHSASSAAIARTNESDGENNNGLGFTSLVGLVKSMSLPDIPLLTEKHEDHHSDDDIEMTSEGRALVTNGNTEKVMVQSPSQNRLSRRTLCCPEEFRAHLRFATIHASYEWQLVCYHKWILILAVIWQYVHKVATNVAYYLHVPGQPLYDLGFQFIPALSKDLQILSEILFFCLFLSTFVFCATPFIKCLSPNANPKSKVQLYAVQMLARYSAVLVMAQTLRSISFLVTLLPGPNYHCRSGSEEYDPPRTLYVILTRMDAFFGCGDLVFSSHTIFVLMCALTITKYAPISRFKKIILWILVIVFGMFVVAARKHYTLDIVVALYTVPLLWIAYEHYFPDYIPPELFAHLPPEVHDRDRSMTSVE